MALHKRVLNWALKPFRKKAPAWKKASDVQKITLGNTLLGMGATGKVYIGNIKFKDGSRQRVAIKRFKEKLSDDKASAYQQVINDLVNAGVRLPKTGMVKLPNGEWVQASQLFSSAKQTKIIQPTFRTIEKLEAKIEAVKELVKIANAGYAPPEDILGLFKGRIKGIIPVDIDALVDRGKQRINNRVWSLYGTIRTMTVNEPEHKKILFDTALNQASPEIKKALENEYREELEKILKK